MDQTLSLDTMDGLTFRTDRSAIIQEVGAGNWNAFAHENGAPELQADTVVNRSLFDFIQGEQVRNQLKQVLEKISQDPNWCWVLPHRCDAPDRERVFCQSLRPVFNGRDCTGFLFQSVEQHSSQRPPIPLFDFKTLQKETKDEKGLPLVSMCSWCQRIKFPRISGDDWIKPEAYYAKGGRTTVRLSHEICEDCLKSTADPFLAKEGIADGREA